MKNKKTTLRSLIIILILSLFVSCIHTTKASAQGSEEHHPETSVPAAANAGESGDNPRIASRFLELLLDKKREPVTDCEPRYFIGGEAIGIRLASSGVRVARSPQASDSPLCPDDKILSINGTPISSGDELGKLLSRNGRSEVTLEIERSGKVRRLKLTPSYNGTEYNLGAPLTDSTTGIGTLTYVCSDGSFGGLGHGIATSGKVRADVSGELTDVILAGAARGERGKPGELRGVLSSEICGAICKNTECGVFGKLTDERARELTAGTPIALGARSELHDGDATIISTVRGTKCAYSAKISSINRTSTDSKSFKIKITDEKLIAETGGIVRGMSGSPIIQDGKLVGAVTHVMVADPTEGYGIFIENMLNAAENNVPKAA